MNKDFFDDWEKDFDKNFKTVRKFVGVGMVFSLIMALVALGVGIWAVVELVQWLTRK